MKKLFIASLSLLILAPLVFAEEVAFTFRDINTGENISDVVVYVVSPKQIMQYVEPNGRLSLNISPGTEMTVLIDDTATKGQDYFATHSVQRGQVVSVFPIGTVRGIVKDALDNVVSRADLKFDCKPVQGIVFPEKTDKFGSFFIEAVPEGTCRIYAAYSNGIGTRIVEIKRGDLKDIEIRLDKTLVSVPITPAYGTIIVLVVILLLVIVFFLARMSRLRKAEAKEVRELRKEEKAKEIVIGALEKGEISKRAQDILKTLHPKERDIVNFLLPRKEATQAEVRHNTGIPRTSLARALHSLEAKNVLKVRTVGRVVKVQLTEWFLEKE
ncbi:MAG: hypothetical protein QXT19_02885 [Candidatus Woesearchaeota archaeon]